VEETDVPIQCGYCKNKSKLTVRAKYIQYLEDDEDEYEDDDRRTRRTWSILECLACKRLNLGESIFEFEEFEEEIIYPFASNEKRLKPLPEPVERAYNSALKVADEPNAFAVLIGRVLEMICKYESAEGQVLADKLRNLADAGRIPPTLAIMAHQLKKLRNLGAHVDDDEVQTSDISIIKDFVDAIFRVHVCSTC
jgi:hypothetical protein